jgi:hypothetical protein
VANGEWPVVSGQKVESDESRIPRIPEPRFFMSTPRRQWLFLIAAGLFCLSGANCRETWPYAPPPRILPPSPTLQQVVEAVNNNNGRIQSFTSNRASVSGPGFPSLRASVAFQRTLKFRLRAETGLTGAEFDLGSNDELFWFWLRRGDPPAVYFCRHDRLAACQARQLLPIKPQWLIEALGVCELNPALPHQGPYQLPNDRLQICTALDSPDGPLTKTTIIDAGQGWILEQHWFDSRRQLLASAYSSRHRCDPLSGLYMPGEVRIICPAAQFDMTIDLGQPEINRVAEQPPGLWTMPVLPGVPAVDISDPNFAPPASPPRG